MAYNKRKSVKKQAVRGRKPKAAKPVPHGGPEEISIETLEEIPVKTFEAIISDTEVNSARLLDACTRVSGICKRIGVNCCDVKLSDAADISQSVIERQSALNCAMAKFLDTLHASLNSIETAI